MNWLCTNSIHSGDEPILSNPFQAQGRHVHETPFIPTTMDVERGVKEYDPIESEAPESPRSRDEWPKSPIYQPAPSFYTQPHFTLLHLAIAFLAGSLGCFFAQYAICGTTCFSGRWGQWCDGRPTTDAIALAPPYVGSTERDIFPPPTPTNVFPSLFPTDVGYAGGTPTGVEPAVDSDGPVVPYTQRRRGARRASVDDAQAEDGVI
ncbi:hypothetical protein EV421DRAFT_286274 [Armillaria borealis]|uniref:Transmembrane protein n=1 Tax=Armillaria borealis TaxID=47425 RepID=A0AA39JQ14_9AGAR|nr:hypothetical protein EV421DRAFT_286274 [Armillaria borealis]